MPLTDLVAPNAIIPALKVNNKKQALQELAARAAMLSGQNERQIFEILSQREKLGSTAIGNGIAIPHGKMANLSRLFGLFARLDRPIDFEALDGQPVDLIFLLLAPEGAGADHLKALQQFTEELKEGLGLPSLYNESLGTVSESYHYDRIKDRDTAEADRPKRPWEKAGALAAAAKKGRA